MTREKHFRGASWHMTIEEVKASETANLREETESGLLYSDVIVGCDCLVIFSFTEQGLQGAGYIIDNDDIVADVVAYEKLKELLKKKYGDPKQDRMEQQYPEKQLQLETYGEWAKAIASGQVKLICSWENENTSIVILCTEDTERYNTNVYAHYWDIHAETDFSGDANKV